VEQNITDVAESFSPGWRPDPSGRYEWRWWDGGWTNRVANTVRADGYDGVADTTPPAPAAPAPSPLNVEAWAEPAIQVGVVDSAPVPVADADSERVTPFGVDAPPTPTRPRRAKRRGVWATLVAFVRSFADQPESYQSKHAASVLPPEARTEQALVSAPRAYGRAGLVALASCGVVAGVFLPWLSGNIEYVRFEQTGADLASPSGYILGALIATIAALLAVRIARLRWVTLAVTLGLAGFIARDLLHTFDTMQNMNRSSLVEANIGTGLWVMMASVAVAMIAAARLLDADKAV
jgi:hypothetical protein